jgi:two-component system, OmpR family, phosphate regulon sensor histidine kinase PhoR
MNEYKTNTSCKTKVLIVDDEKSLGIGIKRLLEKEGYEVKLAVNGNDGIQLGTSEEFDLAIIDLKMPDTDGIIVLEKILNTFPNTICFIATAFASYETAIESTQKGAYGYIPKPFLPDELLYQLKKGYEKRFLLIEAERWKKEREERLLEIAFEKTRLHTIINSITEGVLVVNKNAEAVLFNPAALKYLDNNELKIGEQITEKLHPQIAELISTLLKNDNSASKSYSTQIELKPNHEFFIEATSSGVHHPDGSLAGVVIVLKDITNLKKLEFLKSQFVSMVSHELKAPISAVYGYLKLFYDNSVDIPEDQKKNFINRSQIRLDGLIKMVNDLLDISRMEMKSVKREISDINIKKVMCNIIELFHADLKVKNISVEFNSIQELPFIKADYEEINRLFTNLISNAVKYNRQNGCIIVNINSTELYLVVEIKDSGIGIKEEEKKKLFQEFYRAKNEFTKNISGTGLGLSIVKRIVDSYSGKIEVGSEFNKGTAFKVYLPYFYKEIQKI